MKTIINSLAALVLLAVTAHADCVINAKTKTKFQILDSHTILFSGGLGPDFIVKVWAVVRSTSEIKILKNDFCSHETAVFYIDGVVEDARQVDKL